MHWINSRLHHPRGRFTLWPMIAQPIKCPQPCNDEEAVIMKRVLWHFAKSSAKFAKSKEDIGSVKFLLFGAENTNVHVL